MLITFTYRRFLQLSRRRSSAGISRSDFPPEQGIGLNRADRSARPPPADLPRTSAALGRRCHRDQTAKQSRATMPKYAAPSSGPADGLVPAWWRRVVRSLVGAR